MKTPPMRISATVVGSPDPPKLAAFYRQLLGWTLVSEDSTWVMLRPPAGGQGLSFQWEPKYRRPVWPATSDQQQMTSHLDIAVEDLDAAVAHAIAAGATVAEFQPQERVRVMLDPDGHPFCLFPGPV